MPRRRWCTIDAQELVDHLQATPAMIKRHRARMMPGGVGYSDTPTFGGFGPKSPCSEHAMELGDLEAAFVGNLARYCMHMGTLPPFSLRGLWWVNGECKGLGVVDWDTDVEPIIPLIHHMQHYAPFIVGTEGVDELLGAGEDMRKHSLHLFPQESGDWKTPELAAVEVDRSLRTIERWIKSGSIRSLGDTDYSEVYMPDVRLMKEIAVENMKRGRPRKGSADEKI